MLDDTSGNEDSAPDFFWDSKTRLTDRGWILEMRIPFSSLRYKNADPQEWGVLLSLTLKDFPGVRIPVDFDPQGGRQ